MASAALRLAVSALLLLSAAGCLSIGGGSDTTSTTVVQPTTGQQLIDLKKALDTGALSTEEYETLRQRIISPRSDK
jgi:hypothetical protein